MKILITNPPWIFKESLFIKRFGVRAGSRWPFSGRFPTVYARIATFYENQVKRGPRAIINATEKLIRKVTSPSKGVSKPFPYYSPYPGFMGYATSYLQSQGIEAIFYDAIAQCHDYSTFFRKVDEIKPDIVIQETSTPSFDVDMKIARELYKKYEVCLVGPHATAFAESLIELPFVSYVLKGAYEHSAMEMVKTRRKGVYELSRPVNLDDLPYPYRDEVIIHHYRDANCPTRFALPQLWVYASRGCAYHCDFCLWQHTMFNNKLVLRRPENILGEIDDQVRKFGFKHIYFDDDCWNLGDEKRMMEIADGMKEIGLPWTINARFDGCSKETFKYLVDRGCAGLRLGIESLSQSLLNRLNKGLRVQDILDTLRYLEGLNVDLYLLFMHYVPGETEEDRYEQDREIEKLNHTYQNPPCIPFPGTPFYDKLVQAGYDPKNFGVKWSEYDGGKIGDNLRRLVKEYSRKLLHET